MSTGSTGCNAGDVIVGAVRGAERKGLGDGVGPWSRPDSLEVGVDPWREQPRASSCDSRTRKSDRGNECHGEHDPRAAAQPARAGVELRPRFFAQPRRHARQCSRTLLHCQMCRLLD